VALLDTFTEASDTNLDAHTSDSGHSWTWESSGATTKRLRVWGGAGTCARNNTGSTNATTWYSSSWAPATAEYDVTVDFVHKTDTNITPMRLGARFVDVNNLYEVVFNVNADNVVLNKVVGGTVTQLGSTTLTTTPPETNEIKFEVRDASKKVYLNTVELTDLTTSDNEHTAAGKAALGGGVGNMTSGVGTDGLHYDNLVADDPPGGGTTFNQGASGAVSFAGSVVRGVQKVMTGAIAPAGAAQFQVGKSIAGSLAIAGGLTRHTSRSSSGVLSFAGTVSATKVVTHAIAGAVSFAGDLVSAFIDGVPRVHNWIRKTIFMVGKR
jgi:hypothetical protein